MVSVFLFLFLFGGYASISTDSVDHLPGYGTPKEKQYAGYVEVDPTHHGSLFYWFFESRKKANSNTPVVLWLNGGPGASSLTGALSENGPYHLNDDGETLSDNEFGWNRETHLIYVDQPVGTGYSFCDKDGYATSEEELSAEFYNGLVAFYKLHEEYVSNPLWLTGESYAGKYLPNIATYIKEKNIKEDFKIPLKGVIIGNGLVSPFEQFNSVPDYNRAVGCIDDSQYKQSFEGLNKCKELVEQKKYAAAFNTCNSVSDEINAWCGKPFLYDIRLPGTPDPFAGLTKNLNKYLNSAAVKKALNVGNHSWVSGDGTSVPNPVSQALLGDVMINITGLIPPLLEDFPILFYNGNFDSSCCNHLGTSRMLQKMVWDGQSEYLSAKRQVWKPHSGSPDFVMVKKARNLSFAIINYCGHLVPTNQPDASIEMIYSFINNTLSK